MTIEPTGFQSDKYQILRGFLRNRDVLVADLDLRAHELKARIWDYLNAIERSEHYNPPITFAIRYQHRTGLPSLVWVRIDRELVFHKGVKPKRQVRLLKGLRNGSYQLRIFQGFRVEDREVLVGFELEARRIRQDLMRIGLILRLCEELLVPSSRSEITAPVVED